jgi:hypothetical protein
MKLSPSEQENIIALLTRIYTDIRDIEEEFELLAGEDDFRPRIEHFHDAIRAFSSKAPRNRDSKDRLAIELLAFDVSALRYIQSMPLASFKKHGHVMSPSTDLVAVNNGLTVKRKRPDRAVRERLSELYQHYAVLFAALLKPNADNDYRDRVDEMNQDVQDLHNLNTQFDALAKGKDQLKQVMAAINHLEEDDLRQELLNFMQQQKYKKNDNLKKLMEFLKQHAQKKDKEIASIESAHLNYVMAQLGIFEGSKDMLKKLAAQGMNLVGKFVENSIAESRREMGR